MMRTLELVRGSIEDVINSLVVKILVPRTDAMGEAKRGNELLHQVQDECFVSLHAAHNEEGIVISGHPTSVHTAQQLMARVSSTGVCFRSLPLLPHIADGKSKAGQSFSAFTRQLLKRFQAKKADGVAELTMEIQPAPRRAALPHEEAEEAEETNGEKPEKPPPPSPPELSRLWVYGGSEEDVSKCCTEIRNKLLFLFADEYAEMPVPDADEWTESYVGSLCRVRQVMRDSGVEIQVHREASALLLCGAPAAVETARQAVQAFAPDSPSARTESPASRHGKFEPPPRTEVDQWHAESSPPENGADAEDEPLLDVGSDGPREWYYIDDQNNLQGPFWSEEMHAWRARGWLPGGLRVCRSSISPAASDFYPVADVTTFFRG